MRASNNFRELIHKFCLDYEQDEQKSSTDQVVRERKWTDFLQSLVDFGNKYALRNFQLQLAMQEERW